MSDFGGRNAGTEPTTGVTFLKTRDGGQKQWQMDTWRWRSYSATGKYGRKGVPGRFQVKTPSGGWHNATLPDGLWWEDSWATVVAFTTARACQMTAAITRSNPFLAHMSRSE